MSTREAVATSWQRLSKKAARLRPAGRTHRADNGTIRVAADETTTVSLVVNGRPATVQVAPRVTLADALRDHLGLTGTHLGCEHGVCGMCTVLVDGDAARACLLLACQVDGSEITTVEGLGTQAELHPLQQSFTSHHALQCGFCTPGMLMSAYDLLDHEPDVTAEELPEKMSGVLCRCTGYRGILDAVAEVAQAHPDGVPPPGNCTTDTILPRASLGGSASLPEEPEQQVSATAAEITLPRTEPTVSIEVDEEVRADVDAIWQVMDDTERLARCLPGAELIADFGDDRYSGQMKVALGPVKLSFVGDINVVERDATTHTIRAVAQAKDAGGGNVQASVELHAEPRSPGSVVHARADLHMTGRIAQFGRSLAGDVSRDMFGQFTGQLDAAARGEEPTQTNPPSAAAMATRFITARARSFLHRITRRSKP